MTNLGEIINGDPERYPTLYKMINSPEYKAYNKMYLGDENATYAIYSISSLAYPQFNGVPAYNTAILNQVNGGKVPATVDEFVNFTKEAAKAGYSGWWPYNVKLTNWGEMDATIASPMGTTILAPQKSLAGLSPEGELGTDSEHWTLMTTSEKSKGGREGPGRYVCEQRPSPGRGRFERRRRRLFPVCRRQDRSTSAMATATTPSSTSCTRACGKRPTPKPPWPT